MGLWRKISPQYGVQALVPMTAREAALSRDARMRDLPLSARIYVSAVMAVGAGLLVWLGPRATFHDPVLFAVLLVDYFLHRRRAWNAGPLAPSRPVMVVPWLLGFVAYQLLNPGTVPGWTELWARAQAALLPGPPPIWLSASLTSFVVAGVATLVVAPGRKPKSVTRSE
jgi:hypothetical protein